jgi:hypothetical protein
VDVVKGELARGAAPEDRSACPFLKENGSCREKKPKIENRDKHLIPEKAAL